jgi:hypothetical protein
MSPLGDACPPCRFFKAAELKYYHPQVSILCLPFNEKEITVGMVGPHGSNWNPTTLLPAMGVVCYQGATSTPCNPTAHPPRRGV